VTRVSLNELTVRVGRALQGLGLPAGIADDAADVIAWHDVAGLDGITRLQAAIPRLRDAARTAPAATMADDGRGLDAKGASLLALAGTLVDLLEVADARADGPLVLANARDVDVIGGVAALAAARGLAASFRATAAEASHHAIADGRHVWWAAAPTREHDPATHGTIECWPIADATPWPPARAHHVLDSAALAERRQTALTRGVPVDPDAWAAIYDLAKCVLVDDSGR
jgi:LDH2 family malate/lactate/ureidoglycolate dehydrogenase